MYFFQMGKSVEIIAMVRGLEYNTAHGFHVHQVETFPAMVVLCTSSSHLMGQYGDLSGHDGMSAGEHYNPNGRHHHLPPFLPRHVGDLVRSSIPQQPRLLIIAQGNIQSFSPSTGVAWYRYIDPNIRNLNQLIGRAVIIHEHPDHGSGENCDEGGLCSSLLFVHIKSILPRKKMS